MTFLDRASLAATLDGVNEAMFIGRPIPNTERLRLSRWIAARQGLQGSYANMPAPQQDDFANGFKTFTGERITTRASVAHILGQEACRALILLGVDLPAVMASLAAAKDGFLIQFAGCKRNEETGTYCCGKCSCAFWRHLAAGGLEHPERLLASGVRTLRSRRQGDGQWQAFPFHYTLLALSEMNPHLVRDELRYARGACERLLKRKPSPGVYAQRRRILAERVLEMAG